MTAEDAVGLGIIDKVLTGQTEEVEEQKGE
jgi:ATP-dependent protease ClpP protease subunit